MIDADELEARVRQYRRALEAAARFMEFMEPHLRELGERRDQEIARGLLNRYTSELAVLTPRGEKTHAPPLTC